MPLSTHEQFIALPLGHVFVKSWTPSFLKSQVPMILLHESLGCVELWRDFPEKLAQKLGVTVYAYDRLGFGQSSQRTELPSIHFIQEEATLSLPQICKALGIEKYFLFGHSVGGGIALTNAAHSKNCMAVISESAQAFVEDRTIEGIRAAQKKFSAPAQLDRLKKYHGEKASWVLRAWFDVWLSPEFKDWSLDQDLQKIQCPALVIHGEKDEFGSKAFPERIQSLIGSPCEMHFLKGIGHIPHRENPEQILELVAQFITY